MSEGLENRWPMLPGPKWHSPLQARTWLIEQRRLLGWSHRDVEKAFSACANLSDLYIGPGGGARFDRATEKRVARFERDGKIVPDWLYWMPLAIQYSQVPYEDQWAWEHENIPENAKDRQEREEAEEYSSTYQLSEDEILLVQRYRSMSADERGVFQFLAQPKILRWWISSLERAKARGANLIEIIDNGLS